MKNEQKAQQIIDCNRANCLECGGALSVANGCNEFRHIMAMAQCKDAHVKVVLKDMLRTYYDAPDAYPEIPRSEDEVIKAIADKLNINLNDE